MQSGDNCTSETMIAESVVNRFKHTLRVRSELIAILGIIALTVAVYYPVIGFDFVDLDDDAYVFQNEQVQQGLTLDGVAYAFQTFDMANWNPLTWFSYMVDVELFGVNPAGFHFTNAAIHLANAMLLFVFLRLATSRVWVSAWVAVLFAVHPLHVESVVWISERKDVLSTLFWMLTSLAYLRYSRSPNIAWYGLMAVLFILGLAAKPMLVTLPIGLLLMDYWPLKRFATGELHGRQGSLIALVLEKVPLFIISLVFGIVTLMAQSRFSAVQSLEQLPLATRIANALFAYTGYLEKTLWPGGLAIFYPYVTNIPVTATVLSFLALAAVTATAVTLGRRFPYFIVGWMWYLVTLLPVIGIIQVGSQAMADRYTYVPLVGIFIIFAWGLPDLLHRWKTGSRLILPIAVAVSLTLVVVAHKQVQHWQGSVTLFSHAVAVTRDNHMAHSSLAMGYAKQGQVEAAIKHYQAAIRMHPGDSSLHFKLGNVYLHSAQSNNAISQFELAHGIAPEDPRILNNQAKALIQAGRIPEALQQYRLAIALDPDDPDLHSNLGAALLLDGQLEESEKVFRRILRQNPRFADAHYNLGYLYELNGNLPLASRYYTGALGIDPEHPLARQGRLRLNGQLKFQPVPVDRRRE